jgi:hypothetical protein
MVLVSCFCSISARANVYATDIRVNGALKGAGILLAGNNLTISYILNDNATGGVWVRIYSGANLIQTLSSADDQAGTNAGLNTATWDAPDLAAGAYSVSITAASTGYSTWTNITDDGPDFFVEGPGGITVNKNTNSPFYGRVFVANAVYGADPPGIIKCNADGSPADEGGFSTGGYPWGGQGYSPWKMAVSADDKLYIDDFSGDGVVYDFDQTIENNHYSLAVGADNYPPEDMNPQFSGLAVSGEGANTQIWMTDENYANQGGPDGIVCWNAGTKGVAAPDDTGTIVAPIDPSYLSMRPYDVALDANNFIYTIQYIAPGDNPAYALMSFPPYEGQPETQPDWAIAMYPALTAALGVAVDSGGTYVAVAVKDPYDIEAGTNGGLYLYHADDGDFMANLDRFGGDSYFDVAWDNVSNLYAVDNTAEVWRVYSPPGTNQSTTVAVPLIQAYPSLTPPNLVDPVVGANTCLQFTLQGQSNVTYIVQASCDLINWEPVKTNYSANDNRCIRVPASASQNFYRAVTAP